MVLSSIRKRSGLLILVIGVAMLGFLLTDLMSSGASLFQKGQNLLLKVNNVELDIQNFEKELSEWEQFNRLFSRSNPDRDVFFNQELDRIIIGNQLEKSGIGVGSLEVWDLISGAITDNQTPTFSGWFREQDEAGQWIQYEPDMINSWIEIGVDHGANWSNYQILKKITISQRESIKYINAIKKGLHVTTLEAQSHYVEQTISYDGNYIVIPFSSGDDEAVKITVNDIENYYYNNSSEFPNDPNREVTYFAFNLEPSQEDQQDLILEMTNLLVDRTIFNKKIQSQDTINGFANTNDLLTFFNEYGDNVYQEEMISNSELKLLTRSYPVINSVIGPYLDKGICKMTRLINEGSDSTKLVTLERIIYPSDQTLNKVYSTVHDFMDNNTSITEFKESAKQMSIKFRPVSLSKMDESVPGLGPNRPIVRWAFNSQTNLNESQYFELQDQYIVAVLSNISESDIKPLSDVEILIKKKLIKEHQIGLIENKLSTNDNSSLKDIAQSFNVKIKPLKKLTFNSNQFGLEGYNELAIGAFVGSSLGTISSPIIGNEGVFIFTKSKDTEINYPSNLTTYTQLLKTSYDSQVDLNLIESLKDQADIVDNRFNFY